MKKLLFALLMFLLSLNIAFPIAAANARRPEPDVRILGNINQGPPPGRGPSKPSQVIPWGIERINATVAWETSTGEGVRVAVLDTGVDKDHEDLHANIAWGISVVGGKNSTLYRDWRDKNGHGTHVAGTIAAMHNDIGVVGVGYNIEIYAIKVLADSGFGSWQDAAMGIQWAIEMEIHVISMSFGGSGYSEVFHDAVKAAYEAGIVLVAAAGNEGDEGVAYPAKFSEVIAVAAIDENDVVASWSSKGGEVELAAPGVRVLSTIPKDRYEYYSGTSMACPHVSGTVGLMISKILAEGGEYTVEGIRTILHETADDIGTEGRDNASGYGVVRADKAVDSA